MSKIISINGVDNTGKTTQSRLLQIRNSYSVRIVDNIANFNQTLHKNLDKNGRWFDKNNSNEYMELMFDAISQRQQYAMSCKEDMVILDRGREMFKAVIKASIQVKRGINEKDSSDIVEEFLDKNYGIVPTEDYPILLKYSNNLKENVDITMLRASNDPHPYSREEIDQYRQYQSLLNKNITQQESEGKFYATLPVNTSILEVQNNLRNILNKNFRLPLLATTLSNLVGLSGLSETGKSTIGNALYEKHKFIRLKIAYFARLVLEKHPGLLEESPREFALYLFEALDDFFATHYFFENYTIESLRYVDVISELKAFLGDKFSIIYTNCDRNIAVKRIAVAENLSIDKAMKLVNKKDEEKIMHTANLIEEIADVVIDNNDSLEKLNILIDNISYLRSEQPLDLSNSIDVFPLDSDYREAIKQGINIIKEVDIPIHLLTLSGSCGRFDIKKGKSDIDFFIVVNSKAEAEDLKIKIDNHRLINSIKIGYTIIDKNSFENLGENVDMKIYYLIKNINTLLSPILIKSDIKIPIYHKDELIQSVQKQILSYVQSIQQALYSSIDIKHLLIEHKHTYTVMKLLLLIKGYDQVEGYSAVYNTFYKIFGNTFPHIPKRSFLEDNEFEFKDVKENLSSFIEKVLGQLRLDNDVK